MRVFTIAALLLASAPGLPALAADGEDVYSSVCRKCHRTGIDDAPKAGDKAAWAPRVALGREALVKSVIDGKGAMDPRGGKPELTDEEVRAAVDYLLGLVK